MTNPTAAQPLDPSDMDDIEALALAAPQVWYGTYQIADGITDENAVALIEACSPDTILALIAQARASQPAASIDQPIGHLSPAIGQPDAAICQPQGATGTTGAIELPALPKTCHVVRNGLGGIAFEAYAPEEMEAYARAAIAADRAKCQVSHTAEMAQWARDNNLNVPPHWEAQPASAQPDRGAAVAPSDAKGKAAAANAGGRIVKEVAQRERMNERFAGRANTPATADFDLPAPNDDVPGSHHLTPESIAALIADMKACEAGSEVPSIFDRDWRTQCGVIWRVMEHLAGATSAADAKDAEIGFYKRLSQQAQKEAMRESVRDAIAKALDGLYTCGRVWSAWSYGTMSQDDFALAGEDDDVVDNITDAAIAAMTAAPSSAAGKEGGEA